MTAANEVLLDQVLEREMAMFLSVPMEGPCSCKERPESFLLNRRVQFLAWSAETLRSYRDDLDAAASEGRNLMTYKYARMDDLLPCENQDPLIDEIARQQMTWQEALFREYPRFMKGARPLDQSQDTERATSFETYLRAELETFSPATLALLQRDIQGKRARGINMSEEIYGYLLQAKGLPPLAELEKKLAPAS
jgi:hypothetical protein